MKKLQNTLYITTQGSYLHKERETLVVEQARKMVAQLPVHSIWYLFCFGNVLVLLFLFTSIRVENYERSHFEGKSLYKSQLSASFYRLWI